MAILVFQHTASEGPGRLGKVLRDCGKQLEIRRLDLPLGGPMGNRHVPRTDEFEGVEGVISMGGTMNVGDALPWMDAEMAFLAEAHKRKVPLVGVCLGAQMIAKALGGEVGPMAAADGSATAEWGMLPVRQHPVANTDILLAGIPWSMPQFHCHGQEIKKLPPGATTLQFSEKCKVQSFRTGLRTYGFQYHFEMDLAAIRDFLTCGDPQCALAGVVDTKAALHAAETEYETYERLGDRLSENLASFLFPVTRAITA